MKSKIRLLKKSNITGVIVRVDTTDRILNSCQGVESVLIQ